MAEGRGGILGIVSSMLMLDKTRDVLGLSDWFSNFAKTYIRAEKGSRILDIGCGAGNIIAHLPDVNYVGFDSHAPSIEQAKKVYAGRGFFLRRCLPLLRSSRSTV